MPTSMLIFLYQMMRQTTIQQPIDIEVMLNEVIIPLVILPNRLLHVLELLVRLEVLLPSVPRVTVPDQALAAHLRRKEDAHAPVVKAMHG